MTRKNQLSTIFSILLSFGVFLSFSVILGRLLGGLLPFLDDWVAKLAAFLIAFTVSMFLNKALAPAEVEAKVPPRLGVGMSMAYIGLGLSSLVVAMVLVLVIFPVSGDPVSVELLPKLLTAVCIHPVLEEILFRRVFLYRLLTLSEPEPITEMVPAETDAPLPATPPQPENRAGILFALFTQAILFGLSHLGSGGMLYGFAGGVILGWLMLRTGRLWVTVVCHMLLNLRSLLYPLWSGSVIPLAMDAVLFTIGAICAILLWLYRMRCEKQREVSHDQ